MSSRNDDFFHGVELWAFKNECFIGKGCWDTKGLGCSYRELRHRGGGKPIDLYNGLGEYGRGEGKGCVTGSGLYDSGWGG